MSDFSFRLDGRGDPERLLVLLHGFGATQNDIAPVAAHADPDGRFFALSPRGPIGRNDPNVPLERSRNQAKDLENAGAEVVLSEHDGGHALSGAMLNNMTDWLAAFP